MNLRRADNPTQGVLLLLAGIMYFEQWRRDLSPQLHALLPSKDLLPWSPLRFFGQFLQVFKLRVVERSAEVDEMRRRTVDDALKRAEYRKAHRIKSSGLASRFGLGTKDDAEIEERLAVEKAEAEAEIRIPATGQAREDGMENLDFEGRKRKEPVKKWFGIWS
jgi:hypothetical protein